MKQLRAERHPCSDLGAAISLGVRDQKETADPMAWRRSSKSISSRTLKTSKAHSAFARSLGVQKMCLDERIRLGSGL